MTQILNTNKRIFFEDYLKIGQKVTLISNDIKGNWKGSIARIGKNIDSKTQSVIVYISVNGADLKEGMYHIEIFYTNGKRVTKTIVKM